MMPDSKKIVKKRIFFCVVFLPLIFAEGKLPRLVWVVARRRRWPRRSSQKLHVISGAALLLSLQDDVVYLNWL